MQINIPNNNQRAVLWDLDGTIVDSAPFHKLAWRDTFNRYGMDFTEEKYRFTLGRRNNEIIRRYLGSNLSTQEVDAIAEQKEESFRNYIKDNIRPFPRVVEIISAMAAADFKLAIVSSATIENIRLITGALYINTLFDLFITGKDVARGKPCPQGFLTAADRLGVQPRNCVVIEDAAAGVSAAKTGGMYCVAVTNTCSRKELAAADVVVDRLDEVSFV
jgi:beta-phosphoglucomutase